MRDGSSTSELNGRRPGGCVAAKRARSSTGGHQRWGGKILNRLRFLLAAADSNLKVIICLRNPLEVARP
jgi:hypothetical protein